MVTGAVAGWICAWVAGWSGWLGAPPTNLPQWAGTFFTWNLAVAEVLGIAAIGLSGMGLMWVYVHWWARRVRMKPLAKGVLFGLAWWGGWMTLGLPLFDRVSPLVQNGMILAPGFFARQYGPAAAFGWLLAAVAFGALVGKTAPVWGAEG